VTDEKRVRGTGAIRSACVARFSSGSCHAAALGRPGGGCRQLHETTRAVRAFYMDQRG